MIRANQAINNTAMRMVDQSSNRIIHQGIDSAFHANGNKKLNVAKQMMARLKSLNGIRSEL